MATDATSTGRETSTGLDENLAGALAYLPFLFPLVPIVLFFVENDNRFVKFHAVQSVLLGVAAFAVGIGLGVVATILGFILPDVLGFVGVLFGLVFPLFGFAVFLAFLFMMYKAYQHETFALPVVGGFAHSVAN